MSLTITELYKQLRERHIKPAYLIASDVPLLAQEARDSICKAAKIAGYTQRESFTVTTGFDWSQFAATANNYTIFGDKTLLEIKNDKAKFDQRASKILIQYLKNPPEDKLLLIITNKLTSAQQRTQWCKAFNQHGVTVMIRAVSHYELPNWLKRRFKHAGLQADDQSITLLAELTEGNLLASKQAIEKLCLLYPDQTITAQHIMTVMSDNARFNVFDCMNYALAGQSRHVIRCMTGLRQTGTDPTLVLWALTRQCRELFDIAYDVEQGKSVAQALSKQWQSKRPLFTAALKRLSTSQLATLLNYAQSIDTIIKGLESGEAWQSLTCLALAITGQYQAWQTRLHHDE